MELFANLLPMIIIFGIMYFLFIRPQKRQVEEKQNMLKELKPGQGVITVGGLNGLVDEVNHDLGKVVIDCEGVYLTFELASIGKVLPGQPAQEAVSVDDLSPGQDQDQEEEVMIVEENSQEAEE